MRRLIAILCLMGLVQAGEYGDAFLLSALPARSLAMGYSDVALQHEQGYSFLNPASAGMTRDRLGNATVHRFGSLNTLWTATVQMPVGERWTLNTALLHTGIGDIGERPDLSALDPQSRRDTVRAQSAAGWGTLRHREDAVLLNLATQFSFKIDLGWKFFEIPCTMPVGMTVKVLDKVLAENRGIGSGVDLGVGLHAELADISDRFLNTQLHFGLALQDVLNTPVYWNTKHQDAIKRRWVPGIALSQQIPAWQMRIVVSMSQNALHLNQRQLGAEIGYRKRYKLRFGYDGERLSLGVGVAYKKIIIDYSFGSHELAGRQKIGVVYHF